MRFETALRLDPCREISGFRREAFDYLHNAYVDQSFTSGTARAKSEFSTQDHLLWTLHYLRYGISAREIARRLCVPSRCKFISVTIKRVGTCVSSSLAVKELVSLPSTSRWRADCVESGAFEEYPNLLLVAVDAANIVISNPGHAKARRDVYSIKEKNNRLKITALVTPIGRVVYVSRAHRVVVEQFFGRVKAFSYFANGNIFLKRSDIVYSFFLLVSAGLNFERFGQ